MPKYILAKDIEIYSKIKQKIMHAKELHMAHRLFTLILYLLTIYPNTKTIK